MGIVELGSVVSITTTCSSGGKTTIGSNISRVGLLISPPKCDTVENGVSSESLFVCEVGSVSAALKNPRHQSMHHPFYSSI